MSEKENPKGISKGKKPYKKPELERMNDKIGITSGAPAVPGAAASAQASPIAPGMTVF